MKIGKGKTINPFGVQCLKSVTFISLIVDLGFNFIVMKISNEDLNLDNGQTNVTIGYLKMPYRYAST